MNDARKQAGDAPADPSIASAVERLDQVLARARDIRGKLSEIVDRLDPIPDGGSTKAQAPSPSGLVSAAHGMHDELSEVMDSICVLGLRIRRAIG